jgi:hypothetical protein
MGRALTIAKLFAHLQLVNTPSLVMNINLHASLYVPLALDFTNIYIYIYSACAFNFHV